MPYDCNVMVISDTGNNKIVLVNIETLECIDTIGNWYVGLVDGDFTEWSFHQPQGLCHVYRENEHYV